VLKIKIHCYALKCLIVNVRAQASRSIKKIFPLGGMSSGAHVGTCTRVDINKKNFPLSGMSSGAYVGTCTRVHIKLGGLGGKVVRCICEKKLSLKWSQIARNFIAD